MTALAPSVWRVCDSGSPRDPGNRARPLQGQRQGPVHTERPGPLRANTGHEHTAAAQPAGRALNACSEETAAAHQEAGARTDPPRGLPLGGPSTEGSAPRPPSGRTEHRRIRPAASHQEAHRPGRPRGQQQELNPGSSAPVSAPLVRVPNLSGPQFPHLLNRCFNPASWVSC